MPPTVNVYLLVHGRVWRPFYKGKQTTISSGAAWMAATLALRAYVVDGW
jgi:hypothetical protein